MDRPVYVFLRENPNRKLPVIGEKMGKERFGEATAVDLFVHIKD